MDFWKKSVNLFRCHKNVYTVRCALRVRIQNRTFEFSFELILVEKFGKTPNQMWKKCYFWRFPSKSVLNFSLRICEYFWKVFFNENALNVKLYQQSKRHKNLRKLLLASSRSDGNTYYSFWWRSIVFLYWNRSKSHYTIGSPKYSISGINFTGYLSNQNK